MKTKNRQSGISLIETTIVVAVIALLVGLSLPSVRGLFLSFESGTDAKTLVSAALASAKAIAVNQQRYAGIRFQQDVKGAQYLVFIVHDFDKTGLKNGFRAVDGTQPIKLPTTTGVMDLMVRVETAPTQSAAKDADDRPITETDLDDSIPANQNIYGNIYVTDTTTFSIIFSPSGNLVIHDVRVRNRDGVYQPDNYNPDPDKVSMDDIFNSPTNIEGYKRGMFIQDDYAEYGLGEEPSRRSFVIYDKNKFAQMDNIARFDYLFDELDAVYLNPHTGTIIEK